MGVSLHRQRTVACSCRKAVRVNPSLRLPAKGMCQSQLRQYVRSNDRSSGQALGSLCWTYLRNRHWAASAVLQFVDHTIHQTSPFDETEIVSVAPGLLCAPRSCPRHTARNQHTCPAKDCPGHPACHCPYRRHPRACHRCTANALTAPHSGIGGGTDGDADGWACRYRLLIERVVEASLVQSSGDAIPVWPCVGLQRVLPLHFLDLAFSLIHGRFGATNDIKLSGRHRNAVARRFAFSIQHARGHPVTGRKIINAIA
jgi:hypothetical protein